MVAKAQQDVGRFFLCKSEPRGSRKDKLDNSFRHPGLDPGWRISEFTK
jgi:hypothetical protein